MKILTIMLILVMPIALFAQTKIFGRYRDNFGSRIQLNPDNTFKYTWNLDMSGSWTKGIWTLTNDTIYFHMVPILDTLNQANSNGTTSDTLILSTDEIPERLTQTEFVGMLLSSGGQNKIDHPHSLLYRRKRMYKILNGKLVTKKEKGFWTSKMCDPWFFKSED